MPFCSVQWTRVLNFSRKNKIQFSLLKNLEIMNSAALYKGGLDRYLAILNLVCSGQALAHQTTIFLCEAFCSWPPRSLSPSFLSLSISEWGWAAPPSTDEANKAKIRCLLRSIRKTPHNSPQKLPEGERKYKNCHIVGLLFGWMDYLGGIKVESAEWMKCVIHEGMKSCTQLECKRYQGLEN